jgi:hypothetical protein
MAAACGAPPDNKKVAASARIARFGERGKGAAPATSEALWEIGGTWSLRWAGERSRRKEGYGFLRFGAITALSRPSDHRGQQTVDVGPGSNSHSWGAVHTVQSQGHVGRLVPGAEKEHIWSSS